MPNSDDPKSSVTRFTLRTLLMAITIAAMAMSLIVMYLNNRDLMLRNHTLAKENRRLRDELGSLTVDDVTQLHAIETSSGEQFDWTWRVWIPEGKEYRLRGEGGQVPKAGWPEYGGTMYLRDPGEHVIHYRISRDPRDGKWYGKLLTRGGSVGGDHHQWVEWQSSTSTTSGVGTVTVAFSEDNDSVVELCRHRVSQKDSTGEIEDLAEGFVVWLERIQ